MPPLDLSSLLASPGVPRDAAALNHLDLLSPHLRVWLILKGAVDIFAAPLADRIPSGPRVHLLRLLPGEALFSFLPPDPIRAALSLSAAASFGASLFEFSRVQFLLWAADPLAAPQALRALDAWIARLTEALAPIRSPKEFRTLTPAAALLFDAHSSLLSLHETLWVRPTVGVAFFLGRFDLAPLPSSIHLPVSRSAWIVTQTPGRAHILPSTHILAADPRLAGLDAFHLIAAHGFIILLNDAAVSSVERFVRRREADTPHLFFIDPYLPTRRC